MKSIIVVTKGKEKTYFASLKDACKYYKEHKYSTLRYKKFEKGEFTDKGNTFEKVSVKAIITAEKGREFMLSAPYNNQVITLSKID